MNRLINSPAIPADTENMPLESINMIEEIAAKSESLTVGDIENIIEYVSSKKIQPCTCKKAPFPHYHFDVPSS